MHASKLVPLTYAAMFIVLFGVSARSQTSLHDKIATFKLPPPRAGTKEITLRQATHYFAYPAKEDKNGIALLDKNNHPLGPKLSRRDWCLSSIEGTVVVGGVPFTHELSRGPAPSFCKNWSKKGTSNSRYESACGPEGDGITPPGRKRPYVLVPFRTIATDPDEIPWGTTVYIKDAIVSLPNGKKHDGYFFAADRGSMIGRGHIDVFTGEIDRAIFPFVDTEKAFTVQIVSDPELTLAMENLHLPDCRQ